MENYAYNNSSYPESGDSSPRSREIDFENPPPWEDSSQNNNQIPPNYKVKFMCSYGGKIHPRPHDNQLAYVGGETKILAVDRSVKFAALLSKLIGLCDSDSISFKYQLPGEDLDALISVTNDDDLEHMMHEYDRLYRVSPKPARLRIFVFPSLSQNPSLSSSARSFGSDEGKSEKERFVEALNSAPIFNAPPIQPAAAVAAPQPQPPADFLFGLEKANAIAAAPPPPQVVGRVQEAEDPVFVDERLIGSDPIQMHIQDLQRLRLEEQQQQGATNYRRKSDDNLGYGGGEYYKMPPERTVPGGVPYPVHGGVFPPNNEQQQQQQQQVYMIQAPANPYHHPQMMRPVTGAPSPQGYYTVQRMPQEIYRDQQQQQQPPQMYNFMPSPTAVQSMAAAPPSLPPQKVTGYSEGYGMVRPESGYAQMAYDGNMGRQVIYTAQGGVMGQPAAGQYHQAMAVSAEMRQGGALNQEAGGGKINPKGTQSSV